MKLEIPTNKFINDASIDKLFAEIQTHKDSDDIKRSDVSKFIKQFLENNTDIKPEEVTTEDFYEWFDH
jgi:hypothetical protein